MATSLPFWIRSAKSASKKSGIRSGPRRLRIVKRTGRRDRYTNFPKIFVARVFDLTRRCDDKQCVHLPKAIEMADRDSARRGSPDSLIGGRNRLSSGITGNTTNCGRFHDDRNYFADEPPTPPDPDISVPPPEPVPAADFIEPQETGRVIKSNGLPFPYGHPGKHGLPPWEMPRRSCSARRTRLSLRSA